MDLSERILALRFFSAGVALHRLARTLTPIRSGTCPIIQNQGAIWL